MVNILSVSSCNMLLSWGFPRKYFRSQGINLAPLRASEMVLLNISFYFKRYTAGDDASLGYSILSPPTVNMTRYVSDFSGQ